MADSTDSSTIGQVASSKADSAESVTSPPKAASPQGSPTRAKVDSVDGVSSPPKAATLSGTPAKAKWGDDDYGDSDLPSFGGLQVTDSPEKEKAPDNRLPSLEALNVADSPEKEKESDAGLPSLDGLKLTDLPEEEKAPADIGDVDRPEVVLKSEKLNEDIESPETEIKKVVANDTPYSSAKRFEDLNLSAELIKGLYSEMGFSKPSRIQAETLPMIMTPPYQNLIAQAHNGSGKTTCFVLGMLSRVDPNLKAPQALCVCPTRELVIQNEEVLLKMGKYTGITSCCTASAESAPVSASRRSQIVDQVIIGTPGTLKRWMTRDKILSTMQMKILVFDEADHMLDQDGFQDDSLRILREIRQSKANCQVLLFSATFSEKVKDFAKKTVPQANYIFVEKEALSLDVIKQYQVRCPNANYKVNVLKDKIFPAAEKLGQSIIFARTRQSASDLHSRLEEDGFKCTSIQGGLSHEDRDRVIKEFRSGETKILIATDVLARGFDQAQVTLVVNYDIPTKNFPPHEPDFELYLHRIGRSGRFGRKGAAFNLIANKKDAQDVDRIARHFNREIPEVPWDDDDAFEAVLKEAGLA